MEFFAIGFRKAFEVIDVNLVEKSISIQLGANAAHKPRPGGCGESVYLKIFVAPGAVPDPQLAARFRLPEATTSAP